MTVDAGERGGEDVLVAEERAAAAPSKVRRPSKTRLVEIVFTPDQIAYLDGRMRVVTDVRPMRRAGGSSLGRRRMEGLLAT